MNDEEQCRHTHTRDDVAVAAAASDCPKVDAHVTTDQKLRLHIAFRLSLCAIRSNGLEIPSSSFCLHSFAKQKQKNRSDNW